MAFLESVLGCDILEEALAEFRRGVAFLEGITVLWRGACSVLEGCGIFGGHL